VHGQIKKVLRQYGGRSETPSTFDWAASGLTLLLGYDVDDTTAEILEIDQEVEEWSKLNLMYSISPSNWVKSSLEITDRIAEKKEILELSRPFKQAKSSSGFVMVFNRLWNDTLK